MINMLAGAEHKLLKLVSLIQKRIRGAYMAQQKRVSNNRDPTIASLPLVNDVHALA